MHLSNYVDEVLEHCEECREPEAAPHAPIAGTPTVFTSNKNLQVGRLFLDDLIALNVMDPNSKCSSLIRIRPKSPQQVRDASREGWVEFFGQPKGLRLGA